MRHCPTNDGAIGLRRAKFPQKCAAKIEQLDAWGTEIGLNYRLEIDGSVDLETAHLWTERGADTLIAGTAFFKADDQTRFFNQ